VGREHTLAVVNALFALAMLLLAAQVVPTRGDPAVPGALQAVLASAPAGGPRAAAATRALVGLPYVWSALGEGAGPDPDPRFRLDAFDCLGFVETAVALGSSRSPAEAARALDDIRYQGAPALPARNHEVLSQWIPANLAKGWIAELLPTLAGDRAVRMGKTFTPATWREVHRAGRAVAGLPRGREPLGTFGLWAVRPEDLLALAGRIPEGAVVFVIRADRPDRPTLISHAGLVTLGPAGERRVRHATSTPGIERVIEEPLPRFVARQARAHPSWPLEGFALYAVPDAAARVAALALAEP
jgi:hypothetical protein